MTEDIRLERMDVADLLRELPRGCADLVLADPPWLYEQRNVQGNAADQYPGLPEWEITKHLTATAAVAKDDAYLACWATFPKLVDWIYQSHPHMASVGWQYISGGAWGKTGGLGVGYHFRGDAELVLLYKKGHAKPVDGSQSNLWLADRVGHSEKPAKALRALVRSFCPPGGLVLDCYAGASASLARVCRREGRRYVGAEIDPARYDLALMRLSQQELVLEQIA